MNEVVWALDPGKDFAISEFIGRSLVDAVFQKIPNTFLPPDVLVVEFPKVRSNGNANPNAIVRLAWSAGYLAGEIAAGMVAEVPTVAIPKSIVQKRVLASLEEHERQNLSIALVRVPESKHHNVFDAVRHGLVYLGRMAA